VPQEPSAANPSSNRLLARLTGDDMGLIGPHLEPVNLPIRYKMEVRNRRIDYAYFPESGFASVVATGHGDKSIEVALIGREGMTGLAVLMGTDRTPNDTFIQLAGHGLRIRIENLRRVMERSPGLHRRFLHYGIGPQGSREDRERRLWRARSRIPPAIRVAAKRTSEGFRSKSASQSKHG